MRHFKFVHRAQSGPEEISIDLEARRCVLRRGGETESCELEKLPDGRLSLILEDGRQICGRVLPWREGEVEVVRGGVSRRVALADPLRDRLAHAHDAGRAAGEDEEIRALIPGRVVEVAVAAGDFVAPGALLLVLEAMKMQNEIRTEQGGTVLRLEAEPGRPVEGGTLLAVVRAATVGAAPSLQVS